MDFNKDTVDCYKDFMQDVLSSAEAGGDFSGPIFTEIMCDYLIEEAVMNEYSLVNFKKTKQKMKVDAWEYQEDLGILNMVVSDFDESLELKRFNKANANTFSDFVKRFFKASLDNEFYQSLEESDPAYLLARTIYKYSDNIISVKIIIITNGVLSDRLKLIESNIFEGYSFSYDIWDMGRVCRAINSEDGRESIVIDLEREFGTKLQILPADSGEHELYQSYLLVIPGDILASLYGNYGERLLEQNVRTFLQFRGKVNQGMRNTILHNPNMFFAFNNGVTATAESVDIESTLKGKLLRSIKNLQIVNGGQTTASLYTSKNQLKADLSNVYVQVKLTVIPSIEIGNIVPRISEYSNTQNSVNAADLSSNHEYHRKVEEMSRRISAPSIDGNLVETFWFYERARGAYANAKYTAKSVSERKKFEITNPKSQMFTKTDLAKFIHSWDMKPHIVSKGAQRNFNVFASRIDKDWKKDSLIFNDLYYKEVVGKAILFKGLDKQIMRQEWYGGYKINIVTYTISMFRFLLNKAELFFDFKCLWDKQKTPDKIIESLLLISEKINLSINSPADGTANVGEWCKKEDCWHEIKSIHIDIELKNLPCLINEQVHNENISRSKDIEKIDRGANKQIYVVNQGGEYWNNILEWGVKTGHTTPMQNSSLKIASQIPRKLPTSDIDIKRIIKAEDIAISEGFIANK